MLLRGAALDSDEAQQWAPRQQQPAVCTAAVDCTAAATECVQQGRCMKACCNNSPQPMQQRWSPSRAAVRQELCQLWVLLQAPWQLRGNGALLLQCVKFCTVHTACKTCQQLECGTKHSQQPAWQLLIPGCTAATPSSCHGITHETYVCCCAGLASSAVSWMQGCTS